MIEVKHNQQVYRFAFTTANIYEGRFRKERFITICKHKDRFTYSILKPGDVYNKEEGEKKALRRMLRLLNDKVLARKVWGGILST